MIIINWQTHWKRSSGWVWWINWSDMLARELQWEPQWIWLRLYSRWWQLSRVLVGLSQQWADQGGRRQSICRGHTGRSQRWTCMSIWRGHTGRSQSNTHTRNFLWQKFKFCQMPERCLLILHPSTLLGYARFIGIWDEDC